MCGSSVRGLPASSALNLAGGTSDLKLPFRGAGLSRFLLDQALLDAAARAGAQVIRGATVTRLEYGQKSAVVHTATQQFAASHVALATGKHNLRDLPRPQAPTVAFKMQLRVTPAVAAMLEDLVQLAMFPGGYAGVCLVEGGIATICWVVDRDVTGEAAVTWDAHAVFLAAALGFFCNVCSAARRRYGTSRSRSRPFPTAFCAAR